MQLSDLLLASNDIFKSAGIERPDGQQLESDFAQMAFMFLQDRAPALIPNLLGFEVVESSDDGSRAIGIFGIKVGENLYYVPSFFVNNQIKGMDLLFSKKENSFMPLDEERIHRILDRDTVQLGDSNIPANVEDDFSRPNFDFIAGVPLPGKTASARWGLEIWEDMKAAVIKSATQDPAFQKAFAGAIAAMQGSELAEWKKSAADNELRRYLQNHGGPQAMYAVARCLALSPKYANAVMTFYPGVESVLPLEFDAAMLPAKKAAKLEIITEKNMCCDEVCYDESSREAVIRDGFDIVDRREDSEVSELYDTDYSACFSNPQESGRYNLLLCTGDLAEVDIYLASGQGCGDGAVVVDPKTNRSYTANVSSLYVEGDRISDTSETYEKAVKPDDIEPGKYLLLNERGASSHPIDVRAAVRSPERRTRLGCFISNHVRYDSFRESEFGGDSRYQDAYGDSIEALQLCDTEGGLRRVGTELVVPSNFRFVDLEPRDSDDAYRDLYAELTPGRPSDIVDVLHKNAVHELRVESADQGSTYYIGVDDFRIQPRGFKQAMVSLVAELGLRPRVAGELLKAATESHKLKRYVKFAQGVGVSMPNIPPQDIQGYDDFAGVPWMGPQQELMPGQFTGMPPQQAAMQPGDAIGGQAENEIMRGQVAELAQQAAETGQQQVFEHGSIGGLARLYDTSTVIDQYLPELKKALDRVGRIIFMFYWQNKDFAERYGEEALPDMEDSMRNVFKSFGALVMSLEDKAVGVEGGRDIMQVQ